MSQAATTDNQISTHLRDLEELPPLPSNERRLLALIDNEDVDIHELVSVIETCPPIAARILGLARSAFFSQTIPCRSVFDAVVRALGLDLVKNLVLGIVTSGCFRAERCRGFDVPRYWRRALVAATYGRLLARECTAADAPSANDAYLHGLLHNLGILALAHVAPEAMSRVFALAEKAPERSLTDIEGELLGVDHTEAGSWLAARWHLPPDLVTVIGKQLQRDYRGRRWLACELLRLSIGEASAAVGRCLEDSAVEQPDEVVPDGFRHLGIAASRRWPVARRFQAQAEQIGGIVGVFAGP